MRSVADLLPFHQTAMAVFHSDAEHLDALAKLGVLPQGFDEVEVAVVQATVAYLLAQSVIPDDVKEEVLAAAVEAVVASLGDKTLTTAVICLFANHDQKGEAGHLITDALKREGLLEDTRQALERLGTELGINVDGFAEGVDEAIAAAEDAGEDAVGTGG